MDQIILANGFANNDDLMNRLLDQIVDTAYDMVFPPTTSIFLTIDPDKGPLVAHPSYVSALKAVKGSDNTILTLPLVK